MSAQHQSAIQSSGNAFEAFYANAHAKQRASIQPSTTPITHQLAGLTLEFDKVVATSLNAVAQNHCELSLERLTQLEIENHQDILKVYAEQQLLELPMLERLESSASPLNTLRALGAIFDEPALRFVDAGNKVVRNTKTLLGELNLDQSTMDSIFAHDLMQFHLSNEYLNRTSHATWDVVNGGQLDLLSLPIDDLLNTLPAETAAHSLTLRSCIMTLLSSIQRNTLACDISTLAEMHFSETLTARRYDETLLSTLHTYLFTNEGIEVEQDALMDVLVMVEDAGELWIVQEYIAMFDGADLETPDEIIDYLYHQEDCEPTWLNPLLMRSYVAMRWDTSDFLMLDADGAVSLRQCIAALAELASKDVPLANPLLALAQWLDTHQARFKHQIALEREEESMHFSSAVVALCTLEQARHSGVGEILEESYRYGMETGEISDSFIFSPESFNFTQLAHSFEGVLLSNAALLYLVSLVENELANHL